MDTFEIGQTVRYSRTGTVGKIVSFHTDGGFQYAELDATGLLYRIDQLVAIHEEEHKSAVESDAKARILEEQRKMREMQESAFQNTDQACEGGG
ncbi:MAG TPA: DUF2098 domain-containing protein [Methanocorpusculum sp.]|nr:DUF2098 domain-containing protein [Methanocorpusculum sp.]